MVLRSLKRLLGRGSKPEFATPPKGNYEPGDQPAEETPTPPANYRLEPGPDDLAEVIEDVFVGSAHAAAHPDALADRGITRVLSLTHSADLEATTHHRPLDDRENPQSEFDEAVETARELIRGDERVLIHCEAGVSRAPTVATTAIAAEQNLPYEGALTLVLTARPPANPHPGLQKNARAYLQSVESEE